MLPDHTHRLLSRLLAAYCHGFCPREARGRVRLGYRLERDGATLFEERPICGVAGTCRPVDVARLAFEPARREWRLYAPVEYAGPACGWRRVPGLGGERSVVRLLQAIDDDARGDFWPRVNGASLRWCSSRGRCAGCAQRYRASFGAP